MIAIVKIENIVPRQNNIKYSRFGARPTEKLMIFEKELTRQLKSLELAHNFNSEPLYIKIDIVAPIPKSLSKKEKLKRLGAYKTTVPDYDNYTKGLQDVFCDVLEINDSLICKGTTIKYYTNNIEENDYTIIFEINELPKRPLK